MRIDARSQPVDNHVPDMLTDDLRLFVVRGQPVPVGNEIEGLVLVLQAHPVTQNAMIVTQMQTPSRAHTG